MPPTPYSAKFTKAVEFVLRNEGGYSNHPDDPGGETNFGITFATAKRHNLTPSQVDRDTAIRIYFLDYWAPLMEEIDSDRVATRLLDFRVNMGPGQGTMVVQAACNALLEDSKFHINVDGALGPKTVEAINRFRERTAKRQGDYATANWLMRAMTAEAARVHCTKALEEPRKLSFIYGWLIRDAKRVV